MAKASARAAAANAAHGPVPTADGRLATLQPASARSVTTTPATHRAPHVQSSRATARGRVVTVHRLLDATADPDGRGLLLRGHEFQPVTLRLTEPLLRLARLAERVAESMRDHPDPAVRRSAAVLASRAHPLRTGLDA